MSVDPSVISVVEAAVTADPDNSALRRHWAELLLRAGRPAPALVQAATVLQRRPDDVEALRIAADAAAAVGDDERAQGYRRLISALSDGDRPVSAPTGYPPAIDTAGQIPDTADELVDSWRESAPAPEPDIGELSRPQLTLADVGGMDEVKRRLNLSFLGPLQHPQLRAQFGKSLRGGLLMWGPPGCGKTYIARALAGELGASFYEVGLNDVLDMWLGSSERNLHAVFDVAREHAPCLLFFDEIDALGHKRSNLSASANAMRGVVNQFLVELDGASTHNDGVFILAASNHPWDIDPALMRPGRFDRSLFVEPPDERARHVILGLHLRDKPTVGLDLGRIAKMTAQLSGADLALICDHAAEHALEVSMRDGKVHPISQRDLLDSVRTIKSSIKPWMESAKNYALFGNGSGTYDELAAYLKTHRY